jgi:hypothetical protein
MKNESERLFELQLKGLDYLKESGPNFMDTQVKLDSIDFIDWGYEFKNPHFQSLISS